MAVVAFEIHILQRLNFRISRKQVNIKAPYFRRLFDLLIVGFLIVHPFAATAPGQTKQAPVAKVPESVFRKLISKLVMPIYPDDARKKGEQGVAVASVHLNEQGALIDVQMLEAPSDEIKNAVLNAIRQCRFTAATSEDGPMQVQGKLTFYFVIEHGQGNVKNPKQSKS